MPWLPRSSSSPRDDPVHRHGARRPAAARPGRAGPRAQRPDRRGAGRRAARARPATRARRRRSAARTALGDVAARRRRASPPRRARRRAAARPGRRRRPRPARRPRPRPARPTARRRRSRAPRPTRPARTRPTCTTARNAVAYAAAQRGGGRRGQVVGQRDEVDVGGVERDQLGERAPVGEARLGLLRAHLVLPAAHCAQRPQAQTNGTVTRSPARQRRTRSPTAATVPASSWPGTCGRTMSGSWPCQPCQSLRHTPVAPDPHHDAVRRGRRVGQLRPRAARRTPELQRPHGSSARRSPIAGEQLARRSALLRAAAGSSSAASSSRP